MSLCSAQVAVLLAVGALASAASAEELVAAAAVSLREPIGALADRFEAAGLGERPLVSLGASSTLAAQVRAGAPVDVFVSADERIVDALEDEELIRSADRITLARNRLVVVVREDLDISVKGASDLVRPEIRRVAIPTVAVPVGRYAREWLTSTGRLDALLPRVVVTEHARATLAAVDDGHADAAVVYATDARVARSARIAFVVPDAEQPRIVYTAARIAEARHPEAGARFLRFLGSGEAREVLLSAGFMAP